MIKQELLLGVNIDHIATLRQSRLTEYPDPVQAALEAELAGADCITLHLREDRRHIQERDVELLRTLLQTRMNLEMAVTDDMLAFAEWVIAIANAGVLLGTEGAVRVRAILERSPRYTPWVLAALSMLDACQGDDPEPYLTAAERYTRIGDATDRVLALVHAARAMQAAGTLRRSDPILAEIAEFAGRNEAQRLLDGLPVRS